ncbi:Isoprene synthase protein [Thalictrum thalictroides]|uniref:Isoprene synthase protein n=1 Tax=Thalictrum thalictroides TaxID=46969 RepID=A0A7J6VBH8_THATH|nr:Isoprene synthase protein [Thalictrum thalictroides]
MELLVLITKDEVHLKRAETLKDKVRQLISNKAKGTDLELLELVDDIQRLGMGYIFEGEIRAALDSIKDVNIEETLHETALRFRLFRQHGFKISQEGEDILDEAKTFARVHLKNANGNVDSILAKLVNHALDLPLNLGIVRLEARWYIDLYEKTKNANPIVLELAKLDYNMVQAAHLKDTVDMTRWWNDLGLSKKLTFARDRLVESFLWSVGIQYEPQYKYCREGITKLIILITTIDDVYDVYSTYEEAKLFSEAVERLTHGVPNKYKGKGKLVLTEEDSIISKKKRNLREILAIEYDMLPYADSMPMQPIYNNQQPAMIQPTQLTDQNALELIMNLMVRLLEHYQLHHPPQTDVHLPILPNVMANSVTRLHQMIYFN